MRPQDTPNVMRADRAQGLRQQPAVPARIARRGCLIQLRQNPALCRRAIDDRLPGAHGILPTGKALTGFNHEYKRHGTTTLFAALEVATGLVRAGHYPRRRRVEFLDFMNRLVAAYPGRALHVIVDNLNTHKPKHDRWLARHPHVQLHFTPTHASWLNQVEVWFSILTRAALQGARFVSPQQVRAHIEAFVTAYNTTAHPFEWTKQGVFAKHPKSKYA
jgi:transposase